MEKFIFSGYALYIGFILVAIIVLAIRRHKLKKKESFENREN